MRLRKRSEQAGELPRVTIARGALSAHVELARVALDKNDRASFERHWSNAYDALDELGAALEQQERVRRADGELPS